MKLALALTVALAVPAAEAERAGERRIAGAV